MELRCAWCRKDMGLIAPLQDIGVSHGICKECAEKIKQKEKEKKDAKGKPNKND